MKGTYLHVFPRMDRKGVHGLIIAVERNGDRLHGCMQQADGLNDSINKYCDWVCTILACLNKSGQLVCVGGEAAGKNKTKT